MEASWSRTQDGTFHVPPSAAASLQRGTVGLFQPPKDSITGRVIFNNPRVGGLWKEV